MSIEPIPVFNTMPEAVRAWQNERAARDGWIRRAGAAEAQVQVYKHMADKLLEQLGSPKQVPELDAYCTKHSLYHGRKYPSCRVDLGGKVRAKDKALSKLALTESDTGVTDD